MPDPPNISLPPVFRRTLEYLSGLSDRVFSDFLSILSNLSPALTSAEVTEQFKDALPNGNGATIAGLLEFAVFTRRLVSSLRSEPSTIAAAIVQAYAASPRQDLEDFSGLQERVLAVLENDFIALREKSIDLAGEVPLRFRGARSITDLRPIFAADGNTSELAGFLVLHTIKLQFHGTSNDPIFLVIDHHGIEALKGVLDRALEKETRLVRLLDESKVADLSLRAEQ